MLIGYPYNYWDEELRHKRRAVKRLTHGEKFIVISDCVILDSAPITIGDNCKHPVEAKHHSSRDYKLHLLSYPMRIGNNVQIGGDAIICTGVLIGDNAIIETGATAVRDVSENTVVTPNPARVIPHIENN